MVVVYRCRCLQDRLGSFTDGYDEPDENEPMNDESMEQDEVARWRCFCFPSANGCQDEISLLLLPSSYADLVKVGKLETEYQRGEQCISAISSLAAS